MPHTYYTHCSRTLSTSAPTQPSPGPTRPPQGGRNCPREGRGPARALTQQKGLLSRYRYSHPRLIGSLGSRIFLWGMGRTAKRRHTHNYLTGSNLTTRAPPPLVFCPAQGSLAPSPQVHHHRPSLLSATDTVPGRQSPSSGFPTRESGKNKISPRGIFHKQKRKKKKKRNKTKSQKTYNHNTKTTFNPFAHMPNLANSHPFICALLWGLMTPELSITETWKWSKWSRRPTLFISKLWK